LSRRHHSPLGFAVWRLVTRRESAGSMLARLFGGSAIRAPLTRAIRHGSLVTGELCGPVYESDGRAYRPPSRLPEDDIDRDLGSLCSARILASFLLYAERTDPRTRKGSGSQMWQGNHARRLRLTTERAEPREDGTLPPPGGVREVQRYARLLVGAGVIELLQPNAANVPEGMRAHANAIGDQWAYNLVTLLHALPLALQNALRRWRGLAEIFPPPRPLALDVELEARVLDRIDRALGPPPLSR
jgi:hypothetical protein